MAKWKERWSVWLVNRAGRNTLERHRTPSWIWRFRYFILITKVANWATALFVVLTMNANHLKLMHSKWSDRAVNLTYVTQSTLFTPNFSSNLWEMFLSGKYSFSRQIRIHRSFLSSKEWRQSHLIYIRNWWKPVFDIRLPYVGGNYRELGCLSAGAREGAFAFDVMVQE